MNEHKGPVYIFHLFRKEGDSIILHPFATPEKLIQSLENSEVKARYGAEPRVETLTLLKNDLYRMVEAGVKKWVSDVRFIPKFLISAAAFLVMYFFMSFVIPDPLPIIDEMGIGLAAGIVVYILLGRRDIKSDFAAKRRLSLRTAVDRITFLESEFVKSIEQTLHENESGTIEELTRKILEPAQDGELSESEREEARYFVKVCESMFNLHSAKRDEKMLKKFLEGSQQAVDVQDIKRWVESKKIDVPLYAVYRRCKRKLAASR